VERLMVPLSKYLDPLRPAYRRLRWMLLWRQRRRMRAVTGDELPDERRYWHKRYINPFDPSGPYACQRLRNTYLLPYLKPRFDIESHDKVFAIGSCFARGIELALAQRGFDVVSAARDFDAFERADKQSAALGFTNKYTTHSIVQELGWALDPAARFPEASLVDLDDGTCLDPHINPSLQRLDRAGTLARHRTMTEVMARVKDCRVVFITLGLVEIWYDTQAGVYLNSTPIREMHVKFPGRYRFSATGYPENLANLERVHELLTRYGHPDLKIVVTVSPIPLLATHTPQDVILANTYSKATLRAVAQDWVAAHPNVQYFPSYEIVMNSSRVVAWARDMRHVTGSIATVATDYFVAAFSRGAPPGAGRK
jgi:GSCFA family